MTDPEPEGFLRKALLTVIRAKQSSCDIGTSTLRDTPPSLRSGASPFSCLSGYLDMPLLRYPVITFARPSVGKSSTYCRNVPMSRSKRSCALSACDAMTAELFEPNSSLMLNSGQCRNEQSENFGNCRMEGATTKWQIDVMACGKAEVVMFVFP